MGLRRIWSFPFLYRNEFHKFLLRVEDSVRAGLSRRHEPALSAFVGFVRCLVSSFGGSRMAKNLHVSQSRDLRGGQHSVCA